MTDEFLMSQAEEFFQYHGLTSSPCAKCANLRLKRPGNPFSCTKVPRDERREKYFRIEAAKCPFFEEGRLQLID